MHFNFSFVLLSKSTIRSNFSLQFFATIFSLQFFATIFVDVRYPIDSNDHYPTMLFTSTYLYGDSMRNKMPLDNFEDIEQEELQRHQEKINLIRKTKTSTNIYPEDTEEGYIFCAKLEFSEKVQEKLISYPIVPETLVIEPDMLSQGQQNTWRQLFGNEYGKGQHKKMVNCFQTKEGYTSHYQNLAFLSVLGVKVELLRGYKFRQTSFIAEYVSMCAEQRKRSTNPADKNLWKLMANIIFGKVGSSLFSYTTPVLFSVH